MQGVGFEPPTLPYIATFAFSPQPFSLFFFLLRGIPFCANKSLAGDEKLESKDSPLSSLRKSFVRRPLEKSSGSIEGKLSSMWQSESLESCEKKNSHGIEAALLLSKLWASVYCKVVAVSSASSLFFEEASFERYSSESYLSSWREWSTLRFHVSRKNAYRNGRS